MSDHLSRSRGRQFGADGITHISPFLVSVLYVASLCIIEAYMIGRSNVSFFQMVKHLEHCWMQNESHVVR
jgi:hypothetical protein